LTLTQYLKNPVKEDQLAQFKKKKLSFLKEDKFNTNPLIDNQLMKQRIETFNKNNTQSHEANLPNSNGTNNQTNNSQNILNTNMTK